MKNSNKGFTLIELLVVIAIIGILSSVVLASLNSARQKARDARRIADIKQIQLALELYAGDNSGEYPDTVAALVTAGQMPSEPKDPSTNASYTYDNLDAAAGGACAIADVVGSCMYYQLAALLESNTNTALNSDAAKDLSAAGGIDGEDANCDTTAGAGTDQCYDVAP
jgi:type II secretion system protein G